MIIIQRSSSSLIIKLILAEIPKKYLNPFMLVEAKKKTCDYSGDIAFIKLAEKGPAIMEISLLQNHLLENNCSRNVIRTQPSILLQIFVK